jgi:ATP-dependent DNA helicase 2 subunit 1
MDFDDVTESQNDDGNEQQMVEDFLLLDVDNSTQYKSLKDAVIFLIDCNKTLVEHALSSILAVAESFLKTKIITNENDLFGIITYNTQKTNNILNFDGINVIIPLTAPDAKLIKDVKILSQNTSPNYNKNYHQFLHAEFPSRADETSLNEALWICHQELKNFDAKNFNRRIFLFTDNDSPMADNASERNRTIQRAKDMLESEIVIELFPMNTDRNFDLKRFYCEIIQVDLESNDDHILRRENCDNRLRELTKRIRQKEVKKRTLGKCPFYLTKDVKFQVNFYATIKQATKPKSYNIDAKTNKTLTALNQQICKETGQTLYQNQIGTYHDYGGTKVSFTKDEMKKIKTLDNPGLKLMGFKSFDSIKPYYNIRESYFIYPDDYQSGGSSQLCDALIKQLVSKNKVAIVKFIPREGANIRFCALIPQKETFDEDLFQTPPGFNLIFLPYADEIRSNDDIFKKVQKDLEKNREKCNNIDEEDRDLARKLIKKMNIDFDSRNFENPTLQKFLATIQALALGEGDLEKVEDLLNPYEEGFKRLNNLDVEFNELIFGGRPMFKPPPKKVKKDKKNNDDEDQDEETNNNISEKAVKRKNSEDKTSKRGKKLDKIVDEIDKDMGKPTRSRKKVNNDDEYDDQRLIIMMEHGDLSDFNVSKLKDLCSERAIKLTSKSRKQDIVEKLQEYLLNIVK